MGLKTEVDSRLNLIRFVWCKSLGRPGEEAIDLYSCRRFIISEIDDYNSYKSLIYYMKPPGKEINSPRGWIEYSETYVYLDIDQQDIGTEERIRECAPEEVAYNMLNKSPYVNNLPAELESYRDYANFHVYHKWEKENYGVLYSEKQDPKYLRPVWNGTTLKFGHIVCKTFKNKINNQVLILNTFNSNDWSDMIKSPFAISSRLAQTIKDMNKWDDSPVKFRQSGDSVIWTIDRDRFPTSPTSP